MSHNSVVNTPNRVHSESTASARNLQSNTDIVHMFREYLCSIVTNGPSYRFRFQDFSKCTISEMKSSVIMLIDEMFKHFSQVQFYRNIYKKIVQNSLKTPNQRILDDTLNIIIGREAQNIVEDRNWNATVMFGAFLVEIYKVNAIKLIYVEDWIVKLISKVTTKHLNAEIAMLLVLARVNNDPALTKTVLWKKCMRMVKAMENNKEEASTSVDVDDCSTNQMQAKAKTSEEDSMRAEEEYEYYLARLAENSDICNRFKLTLQDSRMFDLDDFRVITRNENDICSRMLIDKAAFEPNSIPDLVAVLYDCQQLLRSLRFFISLIIKDCTKDIENFEKDAFKSMSSWCFMNYASLFGELYYYEASVVNSKTIVHWIEMLLKHPSKDSIDALFETMKLCGRILKLHKSENFEQYLSVMRNNAVNEVQKEIIRNLEVQVLEDQQNLAFGRELQFDHWSERAEKPPTNPRVTNNFKVCLHTLNNDPNTTLSLRAFASQSRGGRKMDAQFFTKKMLDNNIDALRYAKLLKELQMDSYAIGDFIKNLKKNFMKIIDKIIGNYLESGENPDTTRKLKCLENIGMLICHATNIMIIDNGCIKHLLNGLSQPNLIAEDKFMGIFTNILEVAILHMQVHSRQDYMTYFKFLTMLKTTNPSITSSISCMLSNIFTRELPKAFVEMIYLSKNGIGLRKFTGNELDNFNELGDLAKIFYNNAVTHKLMARNFAKALASLDTTRGTFKEFREHVLALVQMHFPRAVIESHESLPIIAAFVIELFINKMMLINTTNQFLQMLISCKNDSPVVIEAAKVCVDVSYDRLNNNIILTQINVLKRKFNGFPDANRRFKAQQEKAQNSLFPKIKSSSILDKATNMRVKQPFLQIVLSRSTIPLLQMTGDPHSDFDNALNAFQPGMALVNIAKAVSPLSDLSNEESFKKYVAIIKSFLYRDTPVGYHLRELIYLLYLAKNEKALTLHSAVEMQVRAELLQCQNVISKPNIYVRVCKFLNESTRVEVCKTLLYYSNKAVTDVFIGLSTQPFKRQFSNDHLKFLEVRFEKKFTKDIEMKLMSAFEAMKKGKVVQNSHAEAAPKKSQEQKNKALVSEKEHAHNVQPLAQNCPLNSTHFKEHIENYPPKFKSLALESIEYLNKFLYNNGLQDEDKQALYFRLQLHAIKNVDNVNALATAVKIKERHEKKYLNKIAFMIKEHLYLNPHMAHLLKIFADKMTNPKALKAKIQNFVEFDVFNACHTNTIIKSSVVQGMRIFFDDEFIFLLWRNVLAIVKEQNSVALITLVTMMDGNEKLMITSKNVALIDDFLGVLKKQLELNRTYDELKRVVTALEALKKIERESVSDQNKNVDNDETTVKVKSRAFNPRLRKRPQINGVQRPRTNISNKERQKINNKKNCIEDRKIDGYKKVQAAQEAPNAASTKDVFKELVINFATDSLETIVSQLKNLKISSQQMTKEFAEIFFENMLRNVEDISLLIAFARVVDENVKSKNVEISFKQTLVAIVKGKYENLCEEYGKIRSTEKDKSATFVQAKNFHQENEKISKIFGYFFNEGFLSAHELMTFIEKILGKQQQLGVSVPEKFELKAVFNMLHVAAMKLLLKIKEEKLKIENQANSSNIESSEFQNFSEVFYRVLSLIKQVSKSEESASPKKAELTLLCIAIFDILEQLENEIIREKDRSTSTLGESSIAKSIIPPIDEFDRILEYLNDENVDELAVKLLAIEVEENSKDAEKIIEAFANYYENTNESKVSVKLIKYAKIESDRIKATDKKVTFIEKFSNSFQMFAITELASSELSNIRAFHIASIVSHFYNIGLLALNFISKCIQSFFRQKDSLSVAYDCIFIVLETTGADFEQYKPLALADHMKFFEDFLVENGDNSMIGAISHDIVELKKNRWICSEAINSDIFDEFLSDKVGKAAVRLQIMEKKLKSDDFIQTLWKKLMAEPDAAISLADYAYDICQMFDNDFKEKLEKFLEIRRQEFLRDSKTALSKEIKEKFKFAVFFVIELFKLNVLCINLDNWLHPSLIEKLTAQDDKIAIFQRLLKLKTKNFDVNSLAFAKNLEENCRRQ